MAILTYDSLIPFINLDVSGAPDPIVVAMINQAARELCVQSSCWGESEFIPLRANVSDYETAPPSTDAQMRGIRSILLNDTELKPESENNLIDSRPSLLSASGTPQCYYLLKDMMFRVLPKPTDADVGRSMLVRSVFVPALNATTFDSDLIERFSDTLIAGAKARLLAMANKPWSNPVLAAENKLAFDTGVTKARIEVAMSYVNSQMTVKVRRFG